MKCRRSLNISVDHHAVANTDPYPPVAENCSGNGGNFSGVRIHYKGFCNLQQAAQVVTHTAPQTTIPTHASWQISRLRLYWRCTPGHRRRCFRAAICWLSVISTGDVRQAAGALTFDSSWKQFLRESTSEHCDLGAHIARAAISAERVEFPRVDINRITSCQCHVRQIGADWLPPTVPAWRRICCCPSLIPITRKLLRGLVSHAARR